MLIDSLRQGLGETHVFRAFFSNPSQDVLLRYSPGTQQDRSRTSSAHHSDDHFLIGPSAEGATAGVSKRRSPGDRPKLRGIMSAEISQRFIARARALKPTGFYGS
jgi:hypothetical protein